MKQVIALLCAFLLLTTSSCDRMKKKTKETVNKGGEAVGKTATEFIEGISEGVYKTLQCEISLSRNLQDKGVKTGKFSIEDDKADGRNNVLVIYLIFEKDIKDTLIAKVTDKKISRSAERNQQLKEKPETQGISISSLTNDLISNPGVKYS